MATVKNIPEPPVLQPIANKDGKTEHSWQAWFFLLRNAVQSAISAATAQAAILFQNEGSGLGTPGSVDTVNFVGPNINVTRAGNTVTVTENAQSPLLFSDEGVPLGSSGTATSLDVVGAGAALSRVGNALTLTVPGAAGGGQTAIQYQDEGVNLGTPGTVDTVNWTGTAVQASRAGNTLTIDSDQMKFADILAYAAHH